MSWLDKLHIPVHVRSFCLHAAVIDLFVVSVFLFV